MDESATRGAIARFGEVIEATTLSFTAQCYQLYEAPPLGSLVRCGGEHPVYGVVHEIATLSMDPTRHPIARGEDEETEDGVYLSNPQLSRLLLTQVRSVVVGHRSNGDVRRHLAPVPPRIHSFVYQCGHEELATFTTSLDFLPILLAAPIDATDEVIAYFLRGASECHAEPGVFLVEAGQSLAVLLGAELQRLNNLLRRLSP